MTLSLILCHTDSFFPFVCFSSSALLSWQLTSLCFCIPSCTRSVKLDPSNTCDSQVWVLSVRKPANAGRNPTTVLVNKSAMTWLFYRSAGENRRAGGDQLPVDHRNHSSLSAHHGVRQRAFENGSVTKTSTNFFSHIYIILANFEIILG